MTEELDIEEKGPAAGEEEESGGASFTVGFTALIILLLAFFILLSSMSVYDKKRSKEALGSVFGAFGIMPSGIGPLGGERLRTKEAPLLEESFQRSWRNFRDYIKKRKLEHLVAVSGSRKVFRISLASRLLFDSGETSLRPSSLEFLKTVRYLIVDSRNRMRIEGHTDDLQPDLARYPSNWELSAARAVSVLRYFLRDSRIDSTRLSAAGYGQFRSVAPNTDPEGRERNRRVDIVFLGDEGEDSELKEFIEVEGFLFRL